VILFWKVSKQVYVFEYGFVAMTDENDIFEVKYPEVDSPLMTIEEASVYLRIGVRTLREMKSRNEIPVVMMGKRKYFYLKSTLDRIISERETKPTISSRAVSVPKPVNHGLDHWKNKIKARKASALQKRVSDSSASTILGNIEHGTTR